MSSPTVHPLIASTLKNCLQCKLWKDRERGNLSGGFCRLRPPRAVAGETPSWPTKSAHDRCDDWTIREPYFCHDCRRLTFRSWCPCCGAEMSSTNRWGPRKATRWGYEGATLELDRGLWRILWRTT